MHHFQFRANSKSKLASASKEKKPVDTKSKCHLCDGGHNKSGPICLNFKKLSVEKRWDNVRKARACFLCLGKEKGHHCGNCEASPCTNCNKRHHRLLCAGKEKEETASIVSAVARIDGTYMLSAVAAVKDASGALYKAQVVFDNGSDRTMVRSGFAKNLRLRGKKHSLQLSGIGGAAPHAKPLKTELIELEIGHKNDVERTKSGFRTIKAMTIGKICEPIGPYRLKKGWSIDAKNLADDFPYKTKRSVDVLIGLDNYHQFIGNVSRRLEDGSMVINESILGDIISGIGADGINFLNNSTRELRSTTNSRKR